LQVRVLADCLGRPAAALYIGKDLYVACQGGAGNPRGHVIRVCKAESSTFEVLAGQVGVSRPHRDGSAADAIFNEPRALEFSRGEDALFVAEAEGKRVRRITGILRESGKKEVRVESICGALGEGGCRVPFQEPSSLVMAPKTGLLVADTRFVYWILQVNPTAPYTCVKVNGLESIERPTALAWMSAPSRLLMADTKQNQIWELEAESIHIALTGLSYDVQDDLEILKSDDREAHRFIKDVSVGVMRPKITPPIMPQGTEVVICNQPSLPALFFLNPRT